MKRYLLFTGDTYYPGGGWEDFDSDHDTIEEARAKLNASANDKGVWDVWGQIIDTTTMKEIPDGN